MDCRARRARGVRPDGRRCRAARGRRAGDAVRRRAGGRRDRGHDGPPLAVLVGVGTLGYLAGSLGGWAIGRVGGRALIERHARWLHLGPARFARAERWFGRYGSAFVFFGRLMPLVRSFVSIPAGVLEYPLGRYTALSALASLLWCLAFGIAGYALGRHWDAVHHAFRYADYAALPVLVALVATLLARRRGVAA